MCYAIDNQIIVELDCNMPCCLPVEAVKGFNQRGAGLPFDVILLVMELERILQHHHIVIQEQNAVPKLVQMVSMPVLGKPATAQSVSVQPLY